MWLERQDYNTVQSHSALGDLTPGKFERLSMSGVEPART
jgi:transposase InsO family protein